MTEQTPTAPGQDTPPPAKKTTAKKAAVKKAAAAPKPAKVTVEFIGNSRGVKHGDRQRVDAERAAELVDAGLAHYLS